VKRSQVAAARVLVRLAAIDGEPVSQEIRDAAEIDYDSPDLEGRPSQASAAPAEPTSVSNDIREAYLRRQRGAHVEKARELGLPIIPTLEGALSDHLDGGPLVVEKTVWKIGPDEVPVETWRDRDGGLAQAGTGSQPLHR
jgi:hypothetical protein